MLNDALAKLGLNVPKEGQAMQKNSDTIEKIKMDIERERKLGELEEIRQKNVIRRNQVDKL